MNEKNGLNSETEKGLHLEDGRGDKKWGVSIFPVINIWQIDVELLTESVYYYCLSN